MFLIRHSARTKRKRLTLAHGAGAHGCGHGYVCVFVRTQNLDEPQSLTEIQNISSITLLVQIYNITPQCVPYFSQQ